MILVAAGLVNAAVNSARSTLPCSLARMLYDGEPLQPSEHVTQWLEAGASSSLLMSMGAPLGMRWRNKRGGLRWLVELGLCFVLSAVLVALIYGLSRIQGPVQVALALVVTSGLVAGFVTAIVRRLI